MTTGTPARRDVICAGMYRACSTWQYEVVGHLVELHRQGRRMGYVTGDDYQAAGLGNSHEGEAPSPGPGACSNLTRGIAASPGLGSGERLRFTRSETSATWSAR